MTGKEKPRLNRVLCSNALTNCPSALPGVRRVAKISETHPSEARSNQSLNESSRSEYHGMASSQKVESSSLLRRAESSRKNKEQQKGSFNRSTAPKKAPGRSLSQSSIKPAKSSAAERQTPGTEKSSKKSAVPSKQKSSAKGVNETNYFSANDSLGPRGASGAKRDHNSSLSQQEFEEGSFFNSTEVDNPLNSRIRESNESSFSSSTGEYVGRGYDSRRSFSDMSSVSSERSLGRTRDSRHRSEAKSSDADDGQLRKKHARQDHRQSQKRQSDQHRGRAEESDSSVSQSTSRDPQPSGQKRRQIKMRLNRNGGRPNEGEHIRHITLKTLVDGIPVEHNLEVLVSGRRSTKVKLTELWMDNKLLYKL
ncbi:unnamed protein product [Bursaphelenchus okinawaensis]|uniref:Uncharacterized protein n=1 Tax=Bursaphelenchus okinawaensis TaxID=465554 RepID=A0A811K7E6_9BILA|nr:unnamed protein product [Bursaphelenchus okinawaensis]CAG9094104.1 unnamed protein product [Bursaphelenchus okinawaensis]